MNQENFEKKLIAAYDKMMERVNHLLDDAEEQALPALQRNIDKAKKQAVELKEITSDEAEKVAEYLRRDLHDAAVYLENTGKELSSWLSFDLQLVEQRMLDLFARVTDKTRLELNRLAAQAKRAQEYHTGEITGIGTLICAACGSEIHFKKTSRIPPCPKCHKTVFKRSHKH
ncbi:zinc ribbon-containing protein [Methylophaga sp. OBS4]|uniref:zinc ribbon-containing protein n=1 Tax=Methylophaga sp. OBS4 TaxID=2991935 RepID=UPI002253C8F7|nr:zinc ribbon-containing protein [Methylophaga sp. OBS4]MCX4188206.1 zinc ribbon-containing protein [Methylophaga sp. OBS4]